MALKLKLDKDTLLELLETKKDPLFIGLLVFVILIGGWMLYQKTSISADEIIQEATDIDNSRTGNTDQKTVTPEEVVNALLAKRSLAMYQSQRSPFGSPQEQLRRREEVERTYNRAVDLFNAQQFEQAINLFDLVVNKLDVTESRIPYPIMPSEYLRRARREFLKTNFDRMFASAQNDFNEGNRFVTANQLAEAEKVFSRANKTLNDALIADPDGTAIGTDNLGKLKTLQQQVFKKWQTVQSTILKSEIQKGTQEAQQLLSQQDLIALLKSLVKLNQINQSLTSIDPNFTMISSKQRSVMNTLIQRIQDRLKTEYATLCSQADTQFQQALSAEDLATTKETIQIMRMAANINPNPQDVSLQKKIQDAINQRAQLVLKKADEFIAQQQAILNQGDYDKFDPRTKVMFLDELAGLRNLGSGVIAGTLRNQIIDRENTLKRKIRKPPQLVSIYDFISCEPMSRNRYKITFFDKTGSASSVKKMVTLTANGPADRRTQISITEVDKNGGFVILSKPGYSPTKINISQKN